MRQIILGYRNSSRVLGHLGKLPKVLTTVATGQSQFFGVEDVLLLFLRFSSLHRVGFHGVHHGNGIVEIDAVDQCQYIQK